MSGGWETIKRWKQDREPESLFLEFKCKEDPTTPKLGLADKAKIGKTLSGFANTHGGVLVLGVEAHGSGGKAPDHAQELQPVAEVETFPQARQRCSEGADQSHDFWPRRSRNPGGRRDRPWRCVGARTGQHRRTALCHQRNSGGERSLLHAYGE
jgi:hypothetical protein